MGLDPGLLISSIQSQNIVLPGGKIEADGTTITLEPTGDFSDVTDIESISVRIDGPTPTTVYLRDVADIRLGYAEPPSGRACLPPI